MKITLANGTEFEAIKVDGGKRFVQNAQRDVLTFWFAKEAVSFDELDAAFGEIENIDQITMIGGNGEAALHRGYILRLSVSLVPVVMTEETPESAAVTEERYRVELAQETYTERRIRALRLLEKRERGGREAPLFS